MSLDQDDLTKIYEMAAAIVVFNNQNSVPLSGASFPRLRKQLEGQTTLVLPQDFLDVHPDYVSNETQVLTLQGPWSERDAQMTETFARLQDIYGNGRVLGILGTSVSQNRVQEFDDEWVRVRRQADDVATTPTTPTTEEEKSLRTTNRYPVYNATVSSGKGVLMYSSGWPVLKWANGTLVTLETPVGLATVKATRLYTILVIQFADGDNNRDKISLEFSFKQSGGWWTALGVEIKLGYDSEGLNLQAPPSPNAPSAVLGKAYHCSLPLVYSSDEATLTWPNIRMQAFMESTEEFADAFDCIYFTSIPIWSGIMVTSVMLLVLAISIVTIMDIKTMDRFETNRSRQLTIAVMD